MSDSFQHEGEMNSTINIISDPANSKVWIPFKVNKISKYAGDLSVFYFQWEKFRKFNFNNRPYIIDQGMIRQM